MIHTLSIIGALLGSITFTTLSGWRSYMRGKRRDEAVAAHTSPAVQERKAEENSAGLEDFLADVGETL